ncbi:unnamed protein product [Gadus morhua 'NCC']
MERIESSWTLATVLALLLVLFYSTRCSCEDDTDLKALVQDALHGDCEGLRRFMDRDVDCAERFVGLIRRSAGEDVFSGLMGRRSQPRRGQPLPGRRGLTQHRWLR